MNNSIVFQITPVDIPGPVNRRLERSLSVNIHQDMVSFDVSKIDENRCKQTLASLLCFEAYR